MQANTTITIPTGYQRAVRLGANWTMIISPYLILYFGLIVALGAASNGTDEVHQALESAGKTPIAFGANVLLDGLFHALFFGTTVSLFAALRLTWPVRASLILVCGAWQMLMAATKALHALLAFTPLGAMYIAGDAAFQASLLPIATSAYGLWQALQWMDSLGVLAVWLLISALPTSATLPRLVRWLGGIMALAILSLGPGFLLVVMLSPVWLFLLGRWLKQVVVSQGIP